MPGALRKIVIARRAGDTPPGVVDWVRSLSPMLAPLTIALCSLPILRWEMFVGAAAWAILILPGMLAANLLFNADHPLGGAASRPAIASVLGLLPFGMLTWLGCMMHLRLTTVLIAYAIAYVILVGLLCRALLKRSPILAMESEYNSDDDVQDARPLLRSRGLAVGVIAGVIVMLIGVILASPISPRGSSEMIYRNPVTDPGAKWFWWLGSIIGAAGAVAAAAMLIVGALKKTDVQPTDPKETGPRTKKEKSRREPARPSPIKIDKALVAILWIVAAALTAYLMLVTYRLPAEGENRYPYDVDDVTYVSEAVDYRYDIPMGKYEPSYGSDVSMTRPSMSPLFSPLIATVSRMTGIECAALQHSVYPPLMILLGMSALTGALAVVFNKHQWMVPTGLIIALVFLLKSWTHSYTLVEMVVNRATATKSVHLLMLHPLQLATLLLVLRRGGFADIGGGIAVAIVAHLIHPFATILGVIWTGVVGLYALAARRRAVGSIAIIFAAYIALGGVCYWAQSRPLEKKPSGSGRPPGSFINSRGLARLDVHLGEISAVAIEGVTDSVTPQLAAALREQSIGADEGQPVAVITPEQEWVVGNALQGFRLVRSGDKIDVYNKDAKPVLKHDLRWALGNNILFHCGVLCIPILLAAGIRRRNLLVVGLIGAVVFLICNSTLLGAMLSKALPEATMWRTRWMIPSLISLAAVGYVLYEACIAVILRGRHSASAGLSMLAAVFAAGVLSLGAYATSGKFARLGEPPSSLSKFDEDMHGLVGLLGGVMADPYVWGPEHLVTRELPQLMPNVRLVLSRDKLMRAADHENFRGMVRSAELLYRTGRLNPRQFQQILALYPDIDHGVADYARAAIDNRNRRTGKSAGEMQAQAFEKLGWQRVGRKGRYEVWRRPDAGPFAQP